MMYKVLMLIEKFPFFWNQLFRFFKEYGYRYNYNGLRGSRMVINIITAESGWIIYKFADKTVGELKQLGYDVRLSDRYDSKADINHYFAPNNIGYSSYSKVDEHTTFMITHVDTQLKVDQIKELTEKGAVGVCMSLDTRNKLISYGIKPNHVCYINPAQDGMLYPKKINLGFTHRIYSDNRKKDDLIVEVCKHIDSRIFKFSIMGAGWENIIEKLKELGFEVDYYSEFNKEIYNKLILSLDYYCYFGFDEGSMGFVDAIAAGIKTIVTPQGYHLDSGIDITYPVSTINDIISALLEIEQGRKKYIEFADTWTWRKYAEKHIEIWKYMLGIEKLDVLLENRGKYSDGIFSLLLNDLAYRETLFDKISKIK